MVRGVVPVLETIVNTYIHDLRARTAELEVPLSSSLLGTVTHTKGGLFEGGNIHHCWVPGDPTPQGGGLNVWVYSDGLTFIWLGTLRPQGGRQKRKVTEFFWF